MYLQEKINRLKDLNIGTHQKAMLALVVLDKKPATEIQLFKNNDHPDLVEETLRNIGLKVIICNGKLKNENHVKNLSVSNSETTAKMLSLLIEIRNLPRPQTEDKFYHAMYGMIMGFPFSAIEAFINETVLSFDEYPIEVQGNELLPFRLSKIETMKEIEVLRDWENCLKNHAHPIIKELYENVTSS